MYDMTQAIVGTESYVSDENHLQIHAGVPGLTAPCKQWYIDPNPKAPCRLGCVATRQYLSGCLASMQKNATNTGIVQRLS